MTGPLHLNGLRALEAAVRLGSFTAAAAELNVTPAAVGQQVRKLEDAIGRQLLVRHANGFDATEVADLAAAKLASGFDCLKEAVALMQGRTGANRVFISVPPTIGERWLAPRLSRFLAGHSAVDLRIDSTSHVYYRPRAEFDFALRYDRPGASGFDELALFHERLIPVCTPECIEHVGPVDQADCLRAAPLIHADRSTDDPDWLHWPEWGERFGYCLPAEQSGVHASLTTLALRSLYDGHGLHLAQLSITLPDLNSGRLVAPFGVTKCVKPGYPYLLVCIGNVRGNTLLRAFRDWILEEAQRTQAELEAFLGPTEDSAKRRASP